MIQVKLHYHQTNTKPCGQTKTVIQTLLAFHHQEKLENFEYQKHPFVDVRVYYKYYFCFDFFLDYSTFSSFYLKLLVLSHCYVNFSCCSSVEIIVSRQKCVTRQQEWSNFRETGEQWSVSSVTSHGQQQFMGAELS